MTRYKGLLGLLAVASALVFYGGCGGGSSGPPPATVSVTVSPSTASVPIGATQQFTAAVSGTSNTQVTWSIQGAGTGNTTVGSVSSSGLYTAPGAAPSQSVTVVATSQADPSATGTASVTVTVPTPTLTSLSPIVTIANAGLKLTASGSGFAGTSQIVFNGSAKATTLSNGQLTAQLSSSDVAQPGTYPVIVQTNGMSSSSLNFYVVPAINPTPVSVPAGGTTEISIAVQQPKSFASSPLAWVAVGIGSSAGVTAISVKKGASVMLFTVGTGFQAGIFFAVSGSANDVTVTQPLMSDFGQTTDNIPSANVTLNVSSSATPGTRNLLVTNPAGEVSVFPGGLIITQGP